MSNTQSAKGSCLCEKVKVSVKELSPHMGACHCSTCRKWSGGPYLSVNCGSDVNFEGLEYVGTYNSSEWAERGFCKNCGSGLFYRLKSANLFMMPIDLFEDVENIVFTHQVFIDKKPEHYSFANQNKTMTEAEVMAKWG